MDEPATLAGQLATSFVAVIETVDQDIGENKDYGAGIGPHDEDVQVDALVTAVRAQDGLPGNVATAKSDAGTVRYPDGQSADLVIETPDVTEYCEAKLFRFQKANGNPSPRGFSKVFSPYQAHSPRSFVHDVAKLANADVRAAKTLLGLYYRPLKGAGSQITGQDIAQKFAADVECWTEQKLAVDAVAPFDGLQHDVFQRGAVLVWQLAEQPKQYF